MKQTVRKKSAKASAEAAAGANKRVAKQAAAKQGKTSKARARTQSPSNVAPATKLWSSSIPLTGKAIANSPLPFLFGAEAKKLKQRYFLRIITPANAKGQIWLEAFPRYQQDAANIHVAQFIIAAHDMSPVGLRLIQPNEKDYVSYQFYNIVVNNPLRLFKGDPFRASTPLGWQKIVEQPTPPAQASRGPSDSPR